MRYHVPFEHRNRPHRAPGPVFIGFDEPVSIQKRKGRFNWCGFVGLLMALVSPLTLFIIAPLALIFSLFGMRRAPRGMATVGLVLSLMATTVLSLVMIGIAETRHRAHQHSHYQQVQHQNRQQIAETNEILATVQQELREFRADNKHQLPSLDEGMLMTVRHDDAWGEPLRYSVNNDGCVVRSMGPDGEFDTRDDLIVKVDGHPQEFDLASEVLIDGQ